MFHFLRKLVILDYSLVKNTKEVLMSFREPTVDARRG